MRTVALLTSTLLMLGACKDAFSPSEPTPQSVATFSARGRPGEPVPGQYIVVFRPDVAGTEAVARTLAAKHNGKLKHTYIAALKGMAVELSDSAAAALRQDPAVAYVEQDQMAHLVSGPIVQPGATAGLDRIDQRFLPLSGSYSYSADGSGVRVYIIDTGIYFDHTEFGGRAHTGFDAINSGGSAADCHGHGTHVAGTVGGSIYGVAKNVQLYAVRVLDCGGSGTYSQVIAGIDWVTANRVTPAVANMSLGGGFSSALNQAVTNSISAGVTYVVAAGNSAYDACSFSPSSTPTAITVAAADVGDGFAYFSNFGSCVDITAPGVDITSAWLGDPNATETLSGTSMASPHAAGTSALYLSVNKAATPSQVASALTEKGTSGVITGIPAGTSNLLLYSGFVSDSPTEWQPMSEMPSGRRSFMVATATGILYAIGGNNSAGAAVTTNYAYNPSTNSWSTKAPLPAARQSGNGATTISGKIYVAGGQDASGALTRTLYVFNTSTNAWTTKANMPAPGGCGGSAMISGKLYVFSGCTRTSTGGQTASALLHRYDPSTNTWATLRAGPAVHFQPVVGSTGGKLFVVGGNNSSSTPTNRLDVYDPATNSWTTKTAMSTARVGAAGLVAAGKLYVIGGRAGTTYLNTVESYDPLANSWTTRPAMPTARAALGVGVVTNLLYTVGGRNSSSVLTTNERFTP